MIMRQLHKTEAMKSLLINILILLCSLIAIKTLLVLLLIGVSSSSRTTVDGESSGRHDAGGPCTGETYCQQADQHPPPTWNLHTDHPCNIDIISKEEFNDMFPHGFPTNFHKPLIVRIPERNEKYRVDSSKENVASLFPSESVLLPNADLYSFATNNVTISDYINAPEISSWDNVGTIRYMLTSSVKDFQSYIVPPIDAEDVSILDTRFGMGNLGSGAQWHNHGPGFCEALHGRKHWALVSNHRPTYDRSRPSRHWFEYMYSSFQDEYLWECTIHPGDAIYFPHLWHHTTVNLDPYTVFVTTFFVAKTNDTKTKRHPQ